MTARARALIEFERLRAECLSAEPVTDDDRREYQRLIARQRARDEARSQPSPQLDLEQAA